MKGNHKHGYASMKKRHLVYYRWKCMLRRCYEPSNNRYHLYGGRGIKVCARWKKSISNFVEDMGLPPKGKQLDRINNNGNYCKKNCKWSTVKQQAKNRRRQSNSKLYNGYPLMYWSKKYKINYFKLYQRLQNGWSFKDAIYG